MKLSLRYLKITCTFILLFISQVSINLLYSQDENKQHKHPITHKNQFFILPSDCENGDYLGQISILWSEKHFNHRKNENYIFEIIENSEEKVLEIDRNTGELIVINSTQIRGNFKVKIKVKIDSDSSFTTANINVIDKKNVIYIASNGSENGNGTRTSPFKSFHDSKTKNGLPGKYYLYQRNGEYFDKNILIINAESSEKITFGAWGNGERPVINGGYSKNKFVNLGSVFSEQDKAKAAFNVDFMDLHFKNFNDNVIRLTRHGKNFNFLRILIEDSTAINGLLYFMANTDVNELYHSNIYLSDIELKQYSDRGIKIERGGAIAENIRAYTKKESPKAPISPTIMPNVLIRYLEADSNGGTGPNLRQYGQHIEWAYLKGFERAIFLAATANADGNYGPWLLDNNHIRDIIIEGTNRSHGIFFEPMPGATNVAENTEINRVSIKNAKMSGIAVANGSKNVTISYCLIQNSIDYGIRIDENCLGTSIHHCTLLDNGKIDIFSKSLAEVKNSIFFTFKGPLNQSNNENRLTFFKDRNNNDFRPKENSPLFGKGLNLGYRIDLNGNIIIGKPSIGAIQR
jgi:hypothetical protein